MDLKFHVFKLGFASGVMGGQGGRHYHRSGEGGKAIQNYLKQFMDCPLLKPKHSF